jgi:hypothetical protein
MPTASTSKPGMSRIPKPGGSRIPTVGGSKIPSLGGRGVMGAKAPAAEVSAMSYIGMYGLFELLFREKNYRRGKSEG